MRITSTKLQIQNCKCKCENVWRNLAEFLNAERWRSVFILAEQSACCPIWVHASHHRHIFFDSVQPLLALSEQRALGTFFSLFLSASLLRCVRPDGFVSGAVCFVRRTLARSVFLGFQIGVPRWKSVSRQELSNDYLVFTCKTWRRHSRERASQSLPKIRQKLEKKLEKT